MTIPAGQIWEYNASATASNANAGGFDPTNANMLTDLTATSATGNSPVVASASYNFVAGDVGHWLYIKAGTNWTPGFYQIASVASNQATLTATVGTADQSLYGLWYANTVAGCATTGSPTGGTFAIDYSRSTAAPFSATDFGATGSSTTLTSATAAFTPVMVGNTFFQSTTGTGAHGTIGRYSIVSYTNATTVVTDRTTNDGTASVACSGKIGGALSLGSSDDAIFETAVAGNIIYVKNGTFTFGGAVTIASAGSATAPINCVGYNFSVAMTQREAHDLPFVAGANAITSGSHWIWRNLIAAGTGSGVWNGTGSVARWINCKAVNNSTSTGRAAFSNSGGGSNQSHIGNEGICHRGYGISTGSSAHILGGWYHDSDTGILLANATQSAVQNCIVSNNVSAGISVPSSGSSFNAIINNTLFGTTSKRGTGISVAAAASDLNVFNNTISGFATGISQTTAFSNNISNYNNFYNNTTDRTNWNTGKNDVAIDPAFTSVTERTGSTATTTAGNHLVQTGATFQTWGIVAGQDYVYVSGGTGVTAGVYGIASVDSETQITADITLSANATADKTWWIVQGNNFLPTGAI